MNNGNSEMSEDSSIGRHPERPTGILILAVLHLVGGLGILGIQLFVQPLGVNELDQTLRGVGITFNLAMAAILFLAILLLASAVGFLIGKPWGWWVGAFTYVYRTFTNLNAILTAFAYSAELEAGSRGLSHYVSKFGIRTVVSILIIAYLFRSETLEYFGLSEMKRWQSLAILVGANIVLVILFSLLAVLNA